MLAVAALLPILSAGVASGSADALAAATVLLLGIAAFTVYSSPRSGFAGEATRAASRSADRAALAVAALGAAAIAWRGAAWIDAVLHVPHDPYRADMLIVIQQAVRRLLQGHDPYGIYQVPWEAPLPYGPALWAPFVAPAALGMDVRIVTLAGELLLPALLVAFASLAARGGRIAVAAAAVALAAVWLFNPDLARFALIGHTPAYWPWIPVFVYLVAGERWIPAAVVLAVLCVARSTMAAIVPVFAIAVWLRARSCTAAAALAFAAPLLILFGPFAVWDWNALVYGLIGSYERVMKEFVWTQTQWVQGTVGVTGFLLRAHRSRFVEIVQASALLVTYALAWRAFRRADGETTRRPAAWMALALCVFSMTTLWPVTYVYFDVVLLLASALLAADPAGRSALRPRVVAGAVAGSLGFVLLGMRAGGPPDLSIDVGDASARRLLESGFSSDEREGTISFAWVEGTKASVVVPRFSRAPARVVVTVSPASIAGAPPQQMTAAIGGITLGAVTLQPGWQEVTFDAPSSALTAGANELKLYFRQAISPREAGTGDDARPLAAAIDRIRVYSSARLVPSS